MIIEKRIKEFETMGFGMFVHFGLYSILGKGEWAKNSYNIPDEEYDPLTRQFDVEKDWAERLVATAKEAGCRYITLTTRHHDGFSLYDTLGLNEYDAPHSKCGRDLVREFVDECRKADIVPFFYHTLLDWHEKTFNSDFPEYCKYLRKSVEILCTQYGKIGGIWFDGKWSRKDVDWEEDALYGLIRKYQPECMIINNTGIGAQGQLGHPELDSVTFEQGRPIALNLEGSPKYIASEMCETIGHTWGYGAEDVCYKSPEKLIKDLCVCRSLRANLLLNVGPMGNGYLRGLDAEILKAVGVWVKKYDEALHTAVPTGIEVVDHPDCFILKGKKCYYLFCPDVGMGGDGNVVAWVNDKTKYCEFKLPEKIKRAYWLDSGKDTLFKQDGDNVGFRIAPFGYGHNLVVRVAKIEVE